MTRPDDELSNEDELRGMFECFQGPDSPSPVRRRKRRTGLSLALAVFLLVGVGVVSAAIVGDRNERSQSATSSSCRARLEFEDRLYYGGKLNSNDSFQRGALLGSGSLPDCRDTNVRSVSSDGTTTTTETDTVFNHSANVFGVVGIDPVDAVMVEGETDLIYISKSVSDRARAKCQESRDYASLFRCIGVTS